MNTQELFDKIATHLLTQKSRAFDELGRCSYRGKEGTSCAVGCLIEDSQYATHLEGRSINEFSVRLAVERSIGRELIGQEMDLLYRTQRIHDVASEVSWIPALISVALNFNLNTNAIDAIPEAA